MLDDTCIDRRQPKCNIFFMIIIVKIRADIEVTCFTYEGTFNRYICISIIIIHYHELWRDWCNQSSFNWMRSKRYLRRDKLFIYSSIYSSFIHLFMRPSTIYLFMRPSTVYLFMRLSSHPSINSFIYSVRYILYVL